MKWSEANNSNEFKSATHREGGSEHTGEWEQCACPVCLCVSAYTCMCGCVSRIIEIQSRETRHRPHFEFYCFISFHWIFNNTWAFIPSTVSHLVYFSALIFFSTLFSFSFNFSLFSSQCSWCAGIALAFALLHWMHNFISPGHRGFRLHLW